MISPGDKVLIVGDSWGCGEWLYDGTNYGVVHLGLEHYLREYGCEVNNLSEGGSGNQRIIDILQDRVNMPKPDYIFWFQTDPIRDLRPYDQETFPKDVKSLMKLGETLLNDTYKELNDLGFTIHCIGGVTKLQESINQYPNLIPLIPSIVEMFEGPNIDFWVSDWIQCDHLNFSDSFLTELENHPQHTLPREWFFPDGYHPNRNAYHRIFEYILKQHK